MPTLTPRGPDAVAGAGLKTRGVRPRRAAEAGPGCVPARALAQLAERRPVAPGAAAVAICQDRADEKAHFARSRVPCAPFAVLAGVSWWFGFVAVVVGFVVTAVLVLRCRRRFGGITGDVLGAGIELMLAALLVVFSAG